MNKFFPKHACMKIEDIKKFANYYFPRVSYLAQSQPKITSKLLKYIYAKKKKFIEIQNP